jgi:hypothetical protein
VKVCVDINCWDCSRLKVQQHDCCFALSLACSWSRCNGGWPVLMSQAISEYQQLLHASWKSGCHHAAAALGL